PVPLEKPQRSPVSRTTPLPTPPQLRAPPHLHQGQLIRETLYAALGDVLASTPHLHAQLTCDPPCAYYGAVALAILDVVACSVAADGSTLVMNGDGGAVWLVRGTRLTFSECPAPLRTLMREFVTIGVEAARLEEEGTVAAIAFAQEGRTVPVPWLKCARLLLECGAGYDGREGEDRDAGGRRSAEGRVVVFANRVNALALGMTRLPQFKERQAEVFRVLAAVGGGHSS
ncbi:hypothetical protein BJY52DRAFT_1324927, partial [Lactarius psammicola]